ncbi:MAG: copper resistance protein CopC [Chloroflexi bacterium]|nr:copper resistance protein CopC [Chloroflexota bacterium]
MIRRSLQITEARSDSPGARCAPGLRWLAPLLAVLTALLLTAAVASAHAAFVRSEPAPNSVLAEPPGSVTIWFTEPVESRFSEITILDAAGQRVDNKDPVVLPGDAHALSVNVPRLTGGTYTVAWRNISAVDGHPFNGSFVFSIGRTPATAPAVITPEPPLLPSPAEPVLRWLELLAILAIVGGLVFELFISKPVLETAGSDPVVQGAGRQMESRMLTLIWIASGLFFMASIGELVVKASAADAIPFQQALGRPMVSFLQTGWGIMWLWRMGTLLGLAVACSSASLEQRKRRLSGRRQ